MTTRPARITQIPSLASACLVALVATAPVRSHAAPPPENSAAPTPPSPAASPAPPAGLPPGHPQIPGMTEGATEPPPGVPTGPMPPGHPPVPAAGDDPLAQIPQDQISEDASLPPGTIVATIVDEKNAPIGAAPVTLAVLKSTVSMGETRSSVDKLTDANGVVRFDGLERGSAFQYRVVVRAVGADPSVSATYSTQPLQLPPGRGYRLLVHRFPVSTALDGLAAAVEAADTVVEIRDDVIEVQQVFDVINVSTTTWSLGAGMTLALPPGFKGLRGSDNGDDRAVAPVEGTGVRWTGAFPPGVSRISYDFKVPYDGDPSIDLPLEMPPRVLAARVLVSARKGMTLAVDGFPATQEQTTEMGVRVLSTVKRGSPQDQVRTLSIHIGGLPAQGPDKWIAFALGLVLVAAGAVYALRSTGVSDAMSKQNALAVKRRRRGLLADIVLLEQAHRRGEVGPKTYEAERTRLVELLADTV